MIKEILEGRGFKLIGRKQRGSSMDEEQVTSFLALQVVILKIKDLIDNYVKEHYPELPIKPD